jgi:hypothetical protein
LGVWGLGFGGWGIGDWGPVALRPTDTYLIVGGNRPLVKHCRGVESEGTASYH